MKTLYQQKFEDFQKTCLLDAMQLKSRFSEANMFTTDLSTLQLFVSDLLKEKNQAASNNFNYSMERSPDAINDFCSYTFAGNSNPHNWSDDQWKIFADFIKRLAADAPTAQNDNRTTAVSALKDIMGKLMKNLSGFAKENGYSFSYDEIKNIKARVSSFLGIFFVSYKLADPDNNNDFVKLNDGIINYIRENMELLTPDKLTPQNRGVTDLTNYVIDQSVKTFTDNINEESAIKILMYSAPDSIWETKCLQAGISSFEWIEVKR